MAAECPNQLAPACAQVSGAGPKTTVFTDRPQRSAELAPNDAVISALKPTADNPVNAALVYAEDGARLDPGYRTPQVALACMCCCSHTFPQGDQCTASRRAPPTV